MHFKSGKFWELMGGLVTARYGSGAALWNTQLVVVGGWSHNGMLDTMEVYDAEQNSWSTATPTLNTGRRKFVLVVV